MTRRITQLIVINIIASLVAAPAPARQDPRVVVPTAGGVAGPSAAAGSGGFVCGTYRGNERAALPLYYRHEARKRDIAAGRASLLPAADYVYDDVWVVEDDGTILFSGTNAFDTPGQTFRFTPNVAGGYDVVNVGTIFDFNYGSDLGMGDDTESVQALPFGFDFFGASFNDVHVGANGVVGFGANPNPGGLYNADDYWSTAPKIAPLYLDLDPADANSDGVYFRADADSVLVTWYAVAEYGQTRKNTFQLALRADGSFDLRYGGIQSTTQVTGSPIVVGIHPGGTQPASRISFSGALPFSGAAGTGIYEDYYSVIDPVVNETALFQKFYTEFPDSFFQLVYFTNFTQTMSGFANERNIKNHVTGIGLSDFDNSTLYGSNGVLESRCNMNQLSVWFTDPTRRFSNLKANSFLSVMGQESGHRWGAFARFRDGDGQISNLILGRSDAHWSYYIDVDHSSLEGGDWVETAPGEYTCPGFVDYFSQYDEYMMGLRTPEEVAPTFFISSPTNNTTAARSVGTPYIGDMAYGTPVTVTIDDIISAEGPRTPYEPDQGKDLRVAFMLVLKNGTTATQGELDKIAGFRRAWESYLEKSLDGRMTLNTRLHQQWPVAVIRGHVTDRLTDQPVANLEVTSSERGFVQDVPAGGRYLFRYQADEVSNISEQATVEYTAPGYYPKTLNIGIAYGLDVPLDVELDPVPSAADELPRPLPSTLYQNFPNPFNPTTTIPYDVAARASVRLSVYNARGQLVRTLVDAIERPGHKEVTWDGRDDHGQAVASGVYAARIRIGDFTATRKMVLVK